MSQFQTRFSQKYTFRTSFANEKINLKAGWTCVMDSNWKNAQY